MEAEIQEALRSSVMVYESEAKRDILNALSEFCDLIPGTDQYVCTDGCARRMVTLTGTIPVSYKGNTYNIPICLYLHERHPYKAPLCYVRPTHDMTIKPSNNVDPNGRIFLPYLRDWEYPQSDLLGLLQVITIVFGEQCPVFSKPISALPVSTTSDAVPTGPAWPSHSAGAGQALPSGSSGPLVLHNSHQQASAVVPRPLPPYTAHFSPSCATTTTTTPSIFSSYGGGIPGQPEYARLNLMVAVEEKLRAKLDNSMGTLHAELRSVRKTREDLNAGEQKLKSMLTKMKDEQEYLDSTVSALKQSVDEMDNILLEFGAGDEQEIDNAIDTTTPLFRQLMNAYVEDNANEDTIYFLGEALKRGRIDLDNYLKHVRNLSRQQFILRATMQRCRQVAGLPM